MYCYNEFNDSRQPHRVNDHEPSNCFDLLPHEVAIDILCRLPVTSLVQLSFTCRSLNMLVHDPVLVNTHLSGSWKEVPSLILHSDYPLKNQLHFLQLCDKKIRKLSPPFANLMPEYKVVGSCNGILCLVDALLPETMYLYNPLTRDYKELPKNYSFRDQIIVYGFGMDPLTNDYKVIKIGWGTSRLYHRFNPNNSKEPEAQIYSLHTNIWRNKGSFPCKVEDRSSQGLFLNGKLHWTSQFSRFTERSHDRVIVSYNLSDDSFDMIKKPISATRWVNCHLSDLDGCLCVTVTGPRGYGAAHIWVMKEYGVNESWVKAYAIRSYYPESMISHKLERSHHIWRNMFSCSKAIRLVCVMGESGDLVLDYKGGGLVSYDPRNDTFKDLRFAGMPGIYQVTVLVGSLKRVA